MPDMSEIAEEMKLLATEMTECSMKIMNRITDLVAEESDRPEVLLGALSIIASFIMEGAASSESPQAVVMAGLSPLKLGLSIVGIDMTLSLKQAAGLTH